MQNFVERLRHAAKACGVDDYQAAIADSLETSRAKVNKWYKGSEPKADEIFRIARRYGVNPEWLKTGVGEMHSTENLSPEERGLISDYRGAPPRMRDAIRHMARSVRKAIVTVAFTIPALLGHNNDAHAGVFSLASVSVYYVKLRRLISDYVTSLMSSKLRTVG